MSGELERCRVVIEIDATGMSSPIWNWLLLSFRSWDAEVVRSVLLEGLPSFETVGFVTQGLVSELSLRGYSFSVGVIDGVFSGEVHA